MAVLNLPENTDAHWHTDSLLHIFTIQKRRWRSQYAHMLQVLLLLCRKKNIKLKPTFIPTDKLLADKLSRLSGANSIFDIL